MGFYISHKPTCCRIYLLQERAVRIILAADYSAPGKPLFKNLVFLTVTVCILSRFEPSCTCITMKCCLALLLNLFQTGSQIHNYSIRYTELYRPQVCRTNIKQFTILYQGPNLWNSLPLTTNGTLTFNSHWNYFLSSYYLSTCKNMEGVTRS